MKKTLKRIGLIVLIVLLAIVGAVAGYAGSILLSYKRIGDTTLEVKRNTNIDKVEVGETYSVSTYNIGFGAYSQDFTFFLDTGFDEEENETCGYNSKAKNKEEVIKNVNGSIKTMKDLNLDFILLQEVDVKATRSHKVNQDEMFKKEFTNYDSVLCINFDSMFLPYPLYDMHGKSKAGLSTLSKYSIKEAERKEYTISDSLSKLFDLDRCFSVSTIEVSNGKTLYLINSHMSAYDKGGVIRQKQIDELNTFIEAKRSEGNYVIVGGDFNHDLLTYNPEYNYTKDIRPFNMTLKDPTWVASYFDENRKSPLSNNFKVIASNNVPTCRNNDVTWNPDYTYRCVVDGFIVSDNVEVATHYNIETKGGNLGYDGFAYSDHQPAYLEFRLV